MSMNHCVTIFVPPQTPSALRGPCPGHEREAHVPTEQYRFPQGLPSLQWHDLGELSGRRRPRCTLCGGVKLLVHLQ